MTEIPLFPPPPVPEPDPTPEQMANRKLREADMLNLLTQKYSEGYYNGPTFINRYAVARHVRSHAGFDARRTADFVAMDLWPSRGFSLHGHEVKVSRADWLTELKQPEKAQEFIPYMNYWWLVVSDAAFVRDGELPSGWGLMAVRGGRIVRVKQAPRREAEPLSLTRLAALLRAVVKTAGAA